MKRRTRIHWPERYATAVMRARPKRHEPVDLTGVKITQCPPGEAMGAHRLAGIVRPGRSRGPNRDRP